MTDQPQPPYWPPPPGWQDQVEREAAESRAAEQANEEKLRKMREDPPPEGNYTVTLTSIEQTGDPAEEWLPELLLNLAQNPALDIPDGRALYDRVAHIGPETLATGVSDDYAIRLKKTLEWAGAKVKITDGVHRQP